MVLPVRAIVVRADEGAARTAWCEPVRRLAHCWSLSRSAILDKFQSAHATNRASSAALWKSAVRLVRSSNSVQRSDSYCYRLSPCVRARACVCVSWRRCSAALASKSSVARANTPAAGLTYWTVQRAEQQRFHGTCHPVSEGGWRQPQGFRMPMRHWRDVHLPALNLARRRTGLAGTPWSPRGESF